MNGLIEERFDIIRRAMDRAKAYFLRIEDSNGVDHIEHLQNEIGYLKEDILNEYM